MDFQISNNVAKRIVDEIAGFSEKTIFAGRVSDTMMLVISIPKEGGYGTIWRNSDFSVCAMLCFDSDWEGIPAYGDWDDEIGEYGPEKNPVDYEEFEKYHLEAVRALSRYRKPRHQR